MEAHFGHEAGTLQESALSEIEQYVRHKAAAVRYEERDTLDWAATTIFAHCCYLACRLRRPDTVVEIGVAYGVASAFILRALEENGHGVLHSIDLPPLLRNFDRFWGFAVPKKLRNRWRLHRGPSKQVLPKVLEETDTVDIFVRDGSPTYRATRQDFDIVWSFLRAEGIIIANQVELNRAFNELQRQHPGLWRFIRDFDERPVFGGTSGPVMHGIAIK